MFSFKEGRLGLLERNEGSQVQDLGEVSAEGKRVEQGNASGKRQGVSSFVLGNWEL